MEVTENLRELLDTAGSFFAGEAEVVRTYWDWPGRTIETDLHWLELQVFKEFKGSGVGDFENKGVIIGPLIEVRELLPKMDRGVDRHQIRDLLEGLYEEFTHLVAFADVYDAIRPEGTPPIDPHICEGWAEDNVLTQLRYRTIAENGEIGRRASKFTEGGYCTLFREGMAIAGRGGNDELIGNACRLVYEDEFEHMLEGVAGLDDAEHTSENWQRMTDLVTTLLRARIDMRNGQFSYPLSADRIAAIAAGDIKPITFDFETAGRLIAERRA